MKQDHTSQILNPYQKGAKNQEAHVTPKKETHALTKPSQ
jgi:hypothetical protein